MDKWKMVPVAHKSDCGVHNAPAIPRGYCDCGAEDCAPTEADEAVKAAIEALKGLLVPLHGIHGGPLTCVVGVYEDGTEENSARHRGQIDPSKVKAAHEALSRLRALGLTGGECTETYRCVYGGDRCGETYPGPDCPYCEKGTYN